MKSENLIEKKHSVLSPSSSSTWMNCSGAPNLIKKLNLKRKTEKHTALGTAAHKVHDWCLNNNVDAENYRGWSIDVEGFNFKVDTNMIEAVQESLDYITGRINEAEDLGYKVKLLVEVNSSLSYLGVHGLDGGTADVVLLFYDYNDELIEIEVIDYKHGEGIAVDVENNTQAMQYALGVLNEYGLAHHVTGGITITIAQPRCKHGGDTVRSWNINKEYLIDWTLQLITKAGLTQDPNAELTPSDKACQWCPAAKELKCPAIIKRSQEVATLDFKSMNDELPKVETLTTQQKIFIKDNAELLKKFIKDVESNIKSEIEEGSCDYQGTYKLVRKKTNRRLTADALDPITSPLLTYLKHEDVFVEKPNTLGNIEKSLKAELKSKNNTKKFNEIMKEVTMKPEGELAIAFESDKRSAVQPTLISDFNNLD